MYIFVMLEAICRRNFGPFKNKCNYTLKVYIKIIAIQLEIVTSIPQRQ